MSEAASVGKNTPLIYTPQFRLPRSSSKVTGKKRVRLSTLGISFGMCITSKRQTSDSLARAQQLAGHDRQIAALKISQKFPTLEPFKN